MRSRTPNGDRDEEVYATTRISRYKPAATKAVLLFLAGGLWLCIGGMLLLMATSWLLHAAIISRCVSVAAGGVLGLIAYRFGLARIVEKNLKRILPIDERRCVFSFMPWKSYLIIPVMIAMGTALRNSAIPKQYLAILYIGMGVGLVLSGVRYAGEFLNEIRARKSA